MTGESRNLKLWEEINEKKKKVIRKNRKETKIPSRKTCSAGFVSADLMQLDDQLPLLVYGFDMSGMDSFDTGGFDMNVGEGTGQLPEDWEESYGGTGRNDGNENREDENTDGRFLLPGQEQKMNRRILRNGIRISRQKKYILRKKTLWKTEILQQKIPVAAKKDMNFRNRIFGKMKIRG